MDREFLAEVDPIIAQFKAGEDGNYHFHPTEESYPLIMVDRAIDIYARVQHTGLQEAMRDMCGLFDLVYTPPAGWKLNGVSAFKIILVDKWVDATLEFAIHNQEEPTTVEKVECNYKFGLLNFAERVFLCRILSGINVNLPVHRNRELDFVFTFDGKELNIRKPEPEELP